MSTDEYVPEEDDVRMAYLEAHVDMADPITQHQRAQAEREAEDAWTAFLARVRRDAAREALDRAEHRIARLEAQTSIRGRAVAMYRERARKAEAERDEWKALALQERGAALDTLGQIKARDARIKAVEDVLDRHKADGLNPYALDVDIRRALEGERT